ncbi:tRNA uridine-5-carboxymethylaminomethyl(34) synthesis GTPase MnmE [Helicobacter mesocricetorum]|uniref:tRNA uridine-5-carboxymethylaminomethyl(34) synthesis GTPase MnmE n=1 Tax=Helicobacter mesocricetorum TaxID=87012 RepID=UPI001F375E59|nr:tRNA uridine-5-carboxymethylaminomethyl(34) synthesis GTPase MnmE [Helicobacter mesocricetorum]
MMGKNTLSSMNFTINDTIVAPATTYGTSSVNIIRLSGENSLKIASQLARKDLSNLPPRFAKLTKIYFQDKLGQDTLLDECLILYFKAPHSYTTEDVVEFQCHGGTFIAKNIMEECLKYGATLAKPGEFTKRAFLGGRIDLSQAQAIAKLIQSNNAQAHKMLMRHLKGEMQEFCEDLRESLLKILAHSEVFIDYAEEDLPTDLLQSLQEQLDSILQNLSNLLEQSKQKRNLFEGYRICIIGKPNVGKSSLLNALLGDNRAIVSDIAGTTRDSIEENFMLEGHLLRLIDTAGIRKNAETIESEGIQRSLQKAENSDLLLALFDNSRIFDEEDLEILNLLQNYKDSKKIVAIINKNDLKSCFNQEYLASFNPLLLSLKDKDSLHSLKEHLKTILSSTDNNDTLLLTSQYQFATIQTCINALQNSKEPLQNGELELFSFHINEALQAIASITKPYEYSQMLDKMFSDFCLGK